MYILFTMVGLKTVSLMNSTYYALHNIIYLATVLLRCAIGARQSRTYISDISATDIDAVTAVLGDLEKLRDRSGLFQSCHL